MSGLFDKIKKRMNKKRMIDEELINDADEDYVELDTDNLKANNVSKVTVRPYSLEDFSDVKPILNNLRDGNTIVLINIKPLKEKDIVELKRSINKLKKTIDAIDGDIAGFGEDYLIATPSIAKIYREPRRPAQRESETDLTGNDF